MWLPFSVNDPQMKWLIAGDGTEAAGSGQSLVLGVSTGSGSDPIKPLLRADPFANALGTNTMAISER